MRNTERVTCFALLWLGFGLVFRYETIHVNTHLCGGSRGAILCVHRCWNVALGAEQMHNAGAPESAWQTVECMTVKLVDVVCTSRVAHVST
jgi:hypothetical protein